ncbi:MAG: SPOR domain-containing protein [Holosporales bacterium]|jgi:hypothetical protein|nr:SPOR domain-containing protein [Holosporales bacterium]
MSTDNSKLNNGFRKKRLQDDKLRYMKYDDVFMSSERQKPRSLIRQNQHSQQYDFDAEDNEFYDTYQQDEQPVYDTGYGDNGESEEYFSPKNNVINEKMVRYQKRQLPPLQRYSPGAHRDVYAEFNQSYWDEDRGRIARKNFGVMTSIWQKFIVTFSSILSLVCLSWIAYNWTKDKQPSSIKLTPDGIPIIEPAQPSFKVLPETPGGMEILHKDKGIYSKIDDETAPFDQEDGLLLPFQDEASPLVSRSVRQGKVRNDVEEYSIVDEKAYYVKISSGKEKRLLEREVKSLKKNLQSLVSPNSCSVKKVRNASGEEKYAILVGPFVSKNDAMDVAIKCADDVKNECFVISVKDETQKQSIR